MHIFHHGHSSESEETSLISGPPDRPVCAERGGRRSNDTVPSALIAGILKRSGWLGLTTGPAFSGLSLPRR
ncbi:hypothetical protein VZT92_012630 [Zoarces viviparus]